jgi:two-component system chemotaxis sensor kinase CheA
VIDEGAEPFREELIEMIASLEAGLVALEARDRPDPALLGDLFRAAHNIKSAAAMMGWKEAMAVAHAMESALEGARARGAIDQAAASDLLARVDTLRALAQGAESPGGAPPRARCASPCASRRTPSPRPWTRSRSSAPSPTWGR